MFAASPLLVVVPVWVYFTALSRQRSSHKTNASSGECRVRRLLLIGGKCSAYGACMSAAAEVVKRCPIFPCCCGATGGAMAAWSPYILAVYPPKKLIHNNSWHARHFSATFLPISAFLGWSGKHGITLQMENKSPYLSKHCVLKGGSSLWVDFRMAVEAQLQVLAQMYTVDLVKFHQENTLGTCTSVLVTVARVCFWPVYQKLRLQNPQCISSA